MEDWNLQHDQLQRNHIVLKLLLVNGALILILVLRLYYIQVSQYDYHAQLSDQNRLRLEIDDAPRGIIFDRNGKILAQNRPSYQIAVIPKKMGNPEVVIKNLMRIKYPDSTSVFDTTEIREALEIGRWRPFKPIPILEDVGPEVVAIVEEHQLDLPGVVVQVESRREYPYGSALSHVLGYTSEIPEKDYPEYKEKGYRLGSRIGIKGLEKSYEEELRGRDGKRFVEVNVYGRSLRVLQDMPNQKPIPGRNLYTSIDIELQKFAEEIFPDSFNGSVVVLDPRNGEVLTMLSNPPIDGNIFALSKKLRNAGWQKLAFDSRRPLNDRSTIGLYEPGSTFKGVVSLSSFLNNTISPYYNGYTPCHGGFRFGRRYQKCWKPEGHGHTNFFEAFLHSCDTYYYQLGLQLGMEKINQTARLLGLGEKTGIDLPQERSGVLMDSVAYTKKFSARGWRWSRGQILNLAIGQGQLVTPIQLANMGAGLVSGENIYRPHLVIGYKKADQRKLVKITPQILHHIHTPKHITKDIREGLRRVVEPGGTGGRAAVTGIDVGGKTGSAENPHGEKTHALFVGMAPLENPEIVVAVVLENAGHGGSVAAPIAGEILKFYFKGKSNGNQQ